MKTEVLDAARPGAVERAAELLRAGSIVAFPTETVYGLGARADDAGAMAELRRVKGRPAGKPFTRLIGSPADAERHGAPGRAARALARAFWPGPLTIVMADGRGGAVGLRCPDCAVTRELLRLVGTALAAPSANPSGRPPAASAQQVLDAFDGTIAAVLDGGPVRLGVASTVVRAVADEIEVLREGSISEDTLTAALAGGPNGR